MTTLDKFKREQHLVSLLMQRLGISVAVPFANPNVEPGQEAGVDVVATIAAGRIGIQVTEVDTGDVPGEARRAEKQAAREALASTGGVYPAWAQNDPAKMLSAIERAIDRKSKITPSAGFDEVWLLVSAGVPELGSIASTFIITTSIDVAALNGVTLNWLSRSRYNRAFVHSVLGLEQALYQWSPALASWQKDVQPEPLGTQGPSFFDVRDEIVKANRELGSPEAVARYFAEKQDREIEQVLREIREGKIG